MATTNGWAQDFCDRFHGGKCSFCERRKPLKGRIACGPCGRQAQERQAAREAEERAAAEAEHAYELRAAFGPGETVVDVVTGRTYRT